MARGIVDPYFGAGDVTSVLQNPELVASVVTAGIDTLDRGAASTLDAQGGGAIEGSAQQYAVESLHSHHFRFSSFNCST